MTLLLLLGGAGAGTTTNPGVGTDYNVDIVVEFSPTTNPMDTPVWVDITAYLRDTGVTIRRGRNSELDDFQAGTASFTLDNRTRLFDPNYSAGTYFGNLKPHRQFRISLRYASTTYERFRGFITGWPQRYDVSKREAYVPVELVDAFGLFAQADMTEAAFVLDSATFGVLDVNRLGGDDAVEAELSGARVDRVLDLVGWADSLRDLDTGSSTMNSTGPDGSALDYLKNVEVSEDGFLYVSRTGKVTFLERHARYNDTRLTTSQATYSDDGSDNRYSDIVFDYDLDRVYNDVRRTRDGGTEQAVEDSDSITAYFRRVHSVTGLLLTTDAETADNAASFLDRYAEPVMRLPELEVKPLRDPAVMFPAWLSRELLDRVTVEATPMGVGSQYSTQQHIEGYTETFSTRTYTARVQLSPATASSSTVLILDSATQGVLDVNVLAA
jgi:hypothetical protein